LGFEKIQKISFEIVSLSISKEIDLKVMFIQVGKHHILPPLLAVVI